MNFMKQFIHTLRCRTQTDARAMFREGGCTSGTKARFWSGSPWLAFKRPDTGK